MFRLEPTTVGRDQVPALRLCDESAGTSATIVPGFGFQCISFTATIGGVLKREFLYTHPDFPGEGQKGSHNGTPILAPFPNRIRGGCYEYGGTEFKLPCNHGPDAIHGFVLDRAWQRVSSGLDASGVWVEGEVQATRDLSDVEALWPSDFRLRIRYTLSGRTLRSDFEVENPGDTPLPFGLGTHPYFRLPSAPSGGPSNCRLIVPASQCVQLENCLPTGSVTLPANDAELAPLAARGLPVPGRSLDDVFGGLHDEAGAVTHRLIDDEAGIEFRLRHDAAFGFAVVYTPGHGEAVCIEPYTCVTDAINLPDFPGGSGLWELAPGERRSVWIEYEASHATS